MTENIRAIIRRWQKQLFPEEVKQRFDINERAIWSAATLCELDDAYTRRISVCNFFIRSARIQQLIFSSL